VQEEKTMTTLSDVERAERIGRKRAGMFVLQAILFLSWQALFFAGQTETPLNALNPWRMLAWLVWTMLLLLQLALPARGLLLSKPVQALLEDELTQGHRIRAFVIGFWCGVGAAVALYVYDMFLPLTGREAIHIILSALIAGGLFTFALLEWRGRSAA
jgi:hypothetical protein